MTGVSTWSISFPHGPQGYWNKPQSLSRLNFYKSLHFTDLSRCLRLTLFSVLLTLDYFFHVPFLSSPFPPQQPSGWPCSLQALPPCHRPPAVTPSGMRGVALRGMDVTVPFPSPGWHADGPWSLSQDLPFAAPTWPPPPAGGITCTHTLPRSSLRSGT